MEAALLEWADAIAEADDPECAALPRKAAHRISALESALTDLLEYFEAREDVRDGNDGPRPNEEMNHAQAIREALGLERSA